MATTLWKIPFQAVNGDDYRVEIKVEVGTGTAATLIGGASPIVTEEDDDDDLFLPVRRQSGYIQFVDDGSNLGAVMPSSSTDRMVMLYKRTGPYFPGDPTGWTGELVWKGYLQPQTFAGEYLRSPQVRELPICCPLSVLDSWDVEVGVSSGFANFAAILYYIFSKLGTADPSSSDEGYWLAFQGGLQVTEWLSKRVSWDSLGGEDEEGNAEAKYTCLELLEHVCRFFGWICRIDGKTVWFTCPDYATGNFRRMTLSQLYSIANGTYPQTQEVGWSSLYLFDNINVFASRRNTETLVRGIRKATVVAEVDAYDTLLDLPFDKIAKAIRDGNVYRSQYRQAQPASGDDPAIEPGFFYWRYVPYFAGRRFGNIRLTTNQGNSAGSATPHFQARIDDYEFYEGGVMDKHNYAMTTDLYIVGMAGKTQTTPVVINEQMPELIINDDDAINQREGWIIGDNTTPDTMGQVTITTNALAIIETVNGVVLSGGVLVLSGTLQTDYIRGVGHVAVTPNGTLSIRVSIGNNYYIYQGDGDGYWNPNPDATTKETDCWLDVPVRDGAIATTRVLTAPYPAYEGFGMLVHEVGGRMADISGALKIEIRGWEPKGESTITGTIYSRDDEGASLAPSSSAIHYDGSDVNVHITSLAVKFLRHKDRMANADKNQNKYTAAGSNLFRDTKTEHVIWYTDNKNAYGKGILTNTDGSYPTTLIFGSANDRPEQHLANRIATYYGIPRKQYRLELLMSVLATPAPNMYLKIYGNITTYPVALKRDWRDGVMGVTALAIAGSGNHAPNDPDYPQEEAVSVTLHLKNVYVDGSYPDVVLAGETMEAALVADEGYRISSVTITVGGEDTEDLYDETTGIVHIENVWGNVVIDAVAETYVIHDWIETDALGTIDTGFVPTGNDIKIVAKFNVLEYKSTGTWLRIMGAYTGETYNAYRLTRFNATNNQLYAMCGNRANSGKSVSFSLNTTYEMEMTFSQIKLNGTTTSLNSTTGTANTGKFFVAQSNVKLRLWSLQIYKGDTLKLDLVPASILDDACMKDNVSGEYLFPNTDGFVCGDDEV